MQADDAAIQYKLLDLADWFAAENTVDLVVVRLAKLAEADRAPVVGAVDTLNAFIYDVFESQDAANLPILEP